MHATAAFAALLALSVSASPLPLDVSTTAGPQSNLADPAVVSEMQRMMQYSASAYCPAVFQNKTWSCGRPCAGATADSKVVSTFSVKDGFSGVGSVIVNHRTKSI
ncbi:hypothetical protein BC831DRAFT_421152, partial [Entophlyctis helioformis]